MALGVVLPGPNSVTVLFPALATYRLPLESNAKASGLATTNRSDRNRWACCPTGGWRPHQSRIRAGVDVESALRSVIALADEFDEVTVVAELIVRVPTPSSPMPVAVTSAASVRLAVPLLIVTPELTFTLPVAWSFTGPLWLSTLPLTMNERLLPVAAMAKRPLPMLMVAPTLTLILPLIVPLNVAAPRRWCSR